MSDSGQDVEKKRSGEVHSSMLLLEGEVENMREAIRQLGEKVDCVMRHDPEKGKESSPDRSNLSVPIAEDIHKEVDKLSAARKQLNKIMDRLEI